MKKQFNRFVALLLSLMMLLGMLPASTLAAEPTDPVEETAPEPILYFDMNDISDGMVTNQADGKSFEIQGDLQKQRQSPDGTPALELDGHTTYLNVGRDYQIKDAFTASAWMKIDSFTGDRARLFGTGRSTHAEDVEFNVNIKQSDAAAWWSITGVNYGSTSGNAVDLSKWQHVTWVGDKDTMTIYVNGKQVHQQAWGDGLTLDLPEFNTDMLIGASLNADGGLFANHMFSGALDEVRLYDVALTAEQVQDLIVALSDENEITGFNVEGQLGTSVIDEAKHTITVMVPDTMDVTAVAPEITVSEKASIEPASGTAQDFTAPVIYTVTAENGETQTYTVTFMKVDPEEDPYMKQDGTPAYGIKDAVSQPGKLNWLETTEKMPVTVTVDEEQQTLTMENGAIRRVFSLEKDNFYTKSYENTYIGKDLVTGESLPEVYLGLYDKAYDEVYEGKTIKVEPEYYYVGGTNENTFQLDSYQIIEECEKPFNWTPRSKSYSDPAAGDWPPPGQRVEFTFVAPETFPEAYQGVQIKLIYEMYDNCAAMKKRVEITNTADNMVMVGRLAPDVLNGNENMEDLMYTETTYTSGWDCTTPMDDSEQQDKFDALHCLCAQEAEDSPFKGLADRKHTCYDLGPAYELSSDLSVAPHETFISFDTYELVHSTYWFEHQSLERLGFYRKVFPWITDNPLTMHNTSQLSKDIIDHAAAAGFEMIIQSFGSPDISGQMLSRDPEIIAQYKELVDYAHSKGIEVGTYQAQYTLGYGRGTDYGGNEGPVGGGWGAWCMASAAFDDYWDNFKYFVEQTGLDCVEIDGCFAGDACISGDKHVNADRETDPGDPNSTTTGNPSKYAFHHGYFDSKAMQWENAVRMLCKEFRDMDVYIKVPAWYYAAGGNKCGIGYDESHWSQARQHQLAYGRKLMYNASYIRTMSMSWAHIPFSNYHGGGGNAAFRPFAQNVFDYNWVVAQYLGNGVAADFRGPEIYDDTVKPILDHWVNVYQRYRGIINSDMIHITQADSDKDTNYTRNSKMDTLYHVNANNGGADGEKGLLWVYNQTDETRTETITVPMYYTGLTSLDYPTYPLENSMGKAVDHYYGNYTNYEWMPTNIVNQPLPAATPTEDTADFVRDGVTVQNCTIDSNGNVQLEVTLEPMSFTYFAIYDGGHAPEVSVEVGKVSDVKVEGEAEPSGVKLTWNKDVAFTVTENGQVVEHPVQTITGYNIYRDGEKIGTSLTNSFTDETVSENKTYVYEVTALVGTDESAEKSDKVEVKVQADLDAPELLQAKAVEATQIVLTFSEPMDKATAEQIANYVLSNGANVTAAALSEDGMQVTLTVDALTMLQEYTLTVKNLTDSAEAKNPLGEQTRQLIYGYIGYYPMDGVQNGKLENIADGSQAPATGVTYTSGTGKDGCVYFNAADKDYVDLGSGMFNGLSSYTISVEVWPNDLKSEETQAILSAGQPGADKAHNDLGIYLENGMVRFRTSGPLNSGKEVVLQAKEELTSDAWNQIVVTRDGGTFSLYINGKLQDSKTQEDMPAYDSENIIYLGAQKNNAGGDRTSYFGGRVDELLLYRAAMDAEQIAGAYGEYQQYTEAAPIIHLDFEEVKDGKVTNVADGKQFAIIGTEQTITSENGTQGLKFDGKTAINMGNEYQLGGEFTVTAWVNIGTTGDNRNHKIFGRGWTTVPEGEFYACIRNGGYNIDSSNMNGSGKAGLQDFNTAYFPINEWAHFAVTCDGTSVKVYKNGELHENLGSAQNLDLSGNTRELLVGGGWNSTGTGLQGDHTVIGEMDEVRLYDMALTQQDILNIMNGEEVEPVTGVVLDQAELPLTVGQTAQLTATVQPENATNQNVTWATSDDKVATVENGKVTAVAEGEAIITVTTEDGGYTASCKVTVTNPEEPVCTADAAIRVEGQRDQNGNAVFHVTLRDAKNIEAVQVNYNAENVVSITGENGFTHVPAGQEDGILVLCYDLENEHDGQSFECDDETVIATITVSGEKPMVQLEEVLIAAYDGEDGQPAYGAPVDLIQDTATFRGCDINEDGKVDLLDVVAAMKFYQVKKTDGEIWEKAQVADINGDGKVDLEDLIRIVLDIEE